MKPWESWCLWPPAPMVKKVTDDSSIPPCDLSDEWDQLIGHLFVLLK